MDWEKTIIDSLEWGKEISNREEKQKVADKIASMVKDGDIIGGGSGSTAGNDAADCHGAMSHQGGKTGK